MSTKITLPSGASVTLKDPALLRVKDKKRVLKSSETEGGDLSKALALGDTLISVLIEAWSFDLPIPSVKLDSLDELEIQDYDALVEATKEAQGYLFPTLSQTVENETDPKVPTEVSKG